MKPEQELLDINRIVLYSVELNMNTVVYQHNYGAINIDDPEAEGLCVVQFTSMTYTIHESIELNCDTIT